MDERLCQKVAQFLVEHDDRTDDQPAAGFAHARVAVSLAEGLDGEVDGPRDRTTATDDAGRDYVYAISDAGIRVAILADLAHPLATVLFPK